MQPMFLVGNVPKKPKGNIEITKFKVKGDWEEIQITYEMPPEDTEKKTVNYICKERPRSELILAFDELMSHVKAIAGLNWETGMIRALTFKEKEDGLLLGITAECDGDYEVKITVGPFYPTGELLGKIEEAIAHLEDYIDGARAHLSLLDLLPKDATPAAAPEEVFAGLEF
ncbi:MAG: hypothetical protein AB1861_19495 [Cyanobacteriota bacterium]